MKKRLLISSVLMSAVLACALGTGTYAWYSATSGASVSSKTSESSQISTVAQSHTLGGSHQVELTFTPGENNSKLELTDTSGNTYYYDDKSVKYQVDNSSATTVGTMTLTAGWVGNAPSESELATLSGSTVSWSVTANGTIRLLANSQATAASQKQDSLTVQATFDGSTWTVTQNSIIYFAVGPANENGLEQNALDGKVAGGVITATTVAA